MTAEEHSKLTPDKIIENLKRGNAEFHNSNQFPVKNAVKGQYPEAVILACFDSRVPVENIFHCGIGDIFVARVAGNIVNSDILGSMEYACKIAGAKLIVVLGHKHCRAIEAAIDEIELGNITGLLDKIKPAIKQTKVNFIGETKSTNPEFVDAVCQTNVVLMADEIRKNSPVLKELADKGEIKIVEAIYDVFSGKVKFLEN